MQRGLGGFPHALKGICGAVSFRTPSDKRLNQEAIAVYGLIKLKIFIMGGFGVIINSYYFHYEKIVPRKRSPSQRQVLKNFAPLKAKNSKKLPQS
jgi:hypothetical protein